MLYKLIISLMVIVMITSCGGGGSSSEINSTDGSQNEPTHIPTEMPTPITPQETQPTETIEENTSTNPTEPRTPQEAQWRDNKVSNYTLRYYAFCYCFFNESIYTKEVSVVDNEIVKVEIFTGNGEFVREASADEYPNYSTVDDFFQEIEELNSDSWVKQLEVEYNETLGYPTTIAINSDMIAVDGGYIEYIELTVNE